MEMHLLKSTAILAILLLFYKLLLEKENMHVFNRFYLLASLLIGAVVPFVSFDTYVSMPVPQAPAVTVLSKTPPLIVADPFPHLEAGLWVVFVSGVLYFGLRFLLNLSTILLRIRRNPKVKSGEVTNVLLFKDLTPHTFLDFVFLNKGKYESGAIPQEVLEHEKAHAVQKHSWDILLVELVQVVLWFHPLVYLLKKEIKLNHEFLADRAVLRQGIHPARYQQILLSFSSHDIHSNLVHPINYSSIKKRFTVMKTQSSKQTLWLRSLLVLPLLAVLLYGFSSKKVVYTSETSNEISETVSRTGNLETQESATEEMVEEYNKLAAYYNNQEEDYLVVRIKDFARMQYIYKLMSPAQKEKAEPFPSDMIPPPPPPPPAPPKGEQVPEPPVPPSPEESAPFDVTQPIDSSTLPPAPPPMPMDHMKELAGEGATFFYNDKEVNLNKVLDLIKTKKDISIKVVTHDDYPPTVILSSK